MFINFHSVKLKKSGFSLIELMVAVAIVGILAGIAYPSYVEYVTQSNRTEGQRELLRLASQMEQYYLDHRAYTDNMKNLGEIKDPFVSDSGNYKIDASVTGDTFTLTATAQGDMATKDSACKTMTVTDTGAKSPSSGCWE